MPKYVLVKLTGVTISKEAFFGDTELEIEIRKALFPENTYVEVAEAAFDNEASPGGDNYIQKKYDKDNFHVARDIRHAKRKEILDARNNP